MAKYIVEERKTSKYEKNYKFPLVNIIPAIVWSIPVHQKLFPNASFWATLGLCGAFVVFYVMLSYLPIIAVIPAVAGAIIFSGLFWVFADYIENQIVSIILKVLIAVFFGFLELAIFANATVPWLERKTSDKPIIRRLHE